MKKIKKYKAAYLDKNAKPRKIPTNKDVKLEFCLNEINKNNKDNDQNNNSGVSVEIINPPNEAAGVNIQIKAAIFPEFAPNAYFAVPNKTKEITANRVMSRSLKKLSITIKRYNKNNKGPKTKN